MRESSANFSSIRRISRMESGDSLLFGSACADRVAVFSPLDGVFCMSSFNFACNGDGCCVPALAGRPVINASSLAKSLASVGVGSTLAGSLFCCSFSLSSSMHGLSRLLHLFQWRDGLVVASRQLQENPWCFSLHTSILLSLRLHEMTWVVLKARSL